MSRLVGGKLLYRQRLGTSRKIRAARQAVLVTSLMLLEPGPLLRLTWAGLADWRPVLANYNANLTLQAAYQVDDKLTNIGGASQTTNGQTFRQTVTMNTVGYVYHPDLMLFRMSGTYGEDQNSSYTNDVLAEGRGGFENYELESKIFRAKPYTLDLTTQKKNPFVAAPNRRSGEISQESKADFKYRTKGHRAGLKYHNTTNTAAEQGGYSEDVNTIDDFDSFYYFTKPKFGALTGFGLNAGAGYQEDGTTNFAGSAVTRSQQGSLSNTFGYSIFNFNTTVSGANVTAGNMADGSYVSDMRGFDEGVNIRLPWDFDSNIRYATNTANSTNLWTNLSPDNNSVDIPMLMESASSNENFHFLLSQSLYDSLDTKFSASRGSSESSRIERRRDVTGAGGLESGIGENTEYGLDTRYSKALPHNSMATASMSSRSVQRQEPGLNLYYTRSSIQEDCVLNSTPKECIPIDDATDPSGLLVDVLRTSGSECEKAASNPTSQEDFDLNKCWIRLTENVDYELYASEIKPSISVISFNHPYDPNDINNKYGFNYNSFKETGTGLPIEFPLFTFRVTSHRKAADFASQSSRFAAGLSLFRFISSTYQHSQTTQDGNSGGLALTSKVVSDAVSLGLSLHDFSFHADREWQETSYLNTITNLTVSYGKSRKLWNRLTVALVSTAKKGWANVDFGSGGDAEQTKDGYSYTLKGDMPMPYIQANLQMSNSYNYTKGQLTRLELTNNDTLEATRDTGINEQTSLFNSISLLKPFKIPWIDFAGSGYVKYNWDTQTTTNSNGTSDGGKDRSYFSYGANAGRGWQFGSTSINLTANYAITENVFDENRPNLNLVNFGGQSVPSQREEKTDKTSVMLTIVRQLF